MVVDRWLTDVSLEGKIESPSPVSSWTTG